MQLLTAPGIMIYETDNSQYSAAMSNTACYVMGFANKGEVYQPMEFTSRTAWLSYYGEPSNEAERYFYNAACEVLNNGGQLYCSRLPYDNHSIEKMVGVEYNLTSCDLTNIAGYTYSELTEADSELLNAYVINGGKSPQVYDLSTINKYRDDELKVQSNHFIIVDTTCGTYNKVVEDSRRGMKREVIGIIPIVTTAANALYAQNMINVELSNVRSYEVLSGTTFNTLVALSVDSNGVETTLSTDGLSATDSVKQINTDNTIVKVTHRLVSIPQHADLPSCDTMEEAYNYIGSYYTDADECLSTLFQNFNDDNISCNQVNEDAVIINIVDGKPATFDYTLLSSVALDENDVYWATKDGDTVVPETLALDAANYFATIQPSTDGEGFDPEHLKDIGVVVYRAYLDPTEGNKVNFEAVEAFCGSLYKEDKDPNTGVTKFIDTIINSQSKYINFFSNCFSIPSQADKYKNECDILIAKPSRGASLGFYSPMTLPTISITHSIQNGINKCFDKVRDINKLNIDIIPDAGISNIASYLKAIFGNKGQYDLSITDTFGNSLLGLWKCKQSTDACVKMWKTIVQKFDNFCKNVRKDCMFITECPRPLVLVGQNKVVRSTKPDTNVDLDILPYIKAISGLNTNYGAGYINWFEVADEYTGDLFWLPPSIKAMGVYLNTDTNHNYWDAPAGLNRGMIAATDVSFSPTGSQAGIIYEKSWNYAVNYINDGIILEGQKTFQTKPSAFDRVNIRRLFLKLERAAYQVSRYYIFEGNTAYTRQRLVDALDPYFKDAKVNGGIYDYKIICNESNNTPVTIDRNELHVSIGIKPIKTVEFIYVNFVALRTGGSWEEVGM